MTLNSATISPVTINPIYIGMGSNLCLETETHALSSVEILRNAVAELAQFGAVRVSNLYHSKPMGPVDQPDYFNAVACLTPDVYAEPEVWLARFKTLEQQAGRVKKRHWGERTLDLDLIYIGHSREPADHIQVNHAELTVPHVGALLRSFVVMPLLDLDPEFNFAGQYLHELAVAHDAELRVLHDPSWADSVAR